MGLAQQVGKLFNLHVGGAGVRLNCYPAAVAGTAMVAGAAVPVVLGRIYSFKAAGGITVPFRIVGFALDTQSAACLAFNQIGVGTGAGALPTVVTAEWFQQYILVAAGENAPVWLPMAPTITPNGATDAVVGGFATALGGETANGHAVVETGMGN